MRKRSKMAVLTISGVSLLPSVQSDLYQVGVPGLLGFVGLFLLIRFSRIKT